jgi:hypothetical protein
VAMPHCRGMWLPSIATSRIAPLSRVTWSMSPPDESAGCTKCTADRHARRSIRGGPHHRPA